MPRHVAEAEVSNFLQKTANRAGSGFDSTQVPVEALRAAFTVLLIAVEAAVLEVASGTCVLGEVLLASA